MWGGGALERGSHPHVNLVTYCFWYVTARLGKQDGRGVRGRKTNNGEEVKIWKTP